MLPNIEVIGCIKYKNDSSKVVGVHIKPIFWKVMKADKLLPEEINLICSTNQEWGQRENQQNYNFCELLLYRIFPSLLLDMN